MSPRADGLVGRDEELARGREAVEGAASGVRHVVYVGGPGAGKSAVLGALADAAEAEGALVLRAGGAQAEAEIPFAGLSQLLRPALADALDLPLAHQRVLDRVVRIGEPSRQPASPVAMAVLALLELLSRDQTLVLVVDDLQWLDRASTDVLAFVGRRAGGLRLAVLAATRELTVVLVPGATVVELGPLRPPDAQAVLDAHAGGLDPDQRAAVFATAQGNPLALVELPQALGRTTTTGGTADALPLTARIQESFASRLDQLPDATRTLLLLAACLESGELAELAAAARDVGVDLAELDAATEAHLVRTDGQTVWFSHPIVASVIIAQATPAQRRAAHAVLARVLERQPSRALRHRAAAATVADEDLAAELEEAAAALAGPSSLAGVVATLDRAASLSVDPTARARRLASAADAARAAGRYRAAEARLARIDLTDADPPTRLGVASQRAWHQFDTGDVDTALGMLVGVLEQGVELGRRESIRPAALAGLARWLSGNRRYDARLRDLLRDLDDHLDGATPALAVMALAAAGATRSPEAVLGALQTAAADASVQGASRLGTVATADTRAGELARLADAALMVDAIGPGQALSRLASDQLRAQGSFGALATALATRCHAELCAGNWDTATALAREALDITSVTGQQRQAAFVNADLAYLAAARGRTDEARLLRQEVSAWAAPRHHRLIAALAAGSQLLTVLAAGDTEVAAGAVAAMRPVQGGPGDVGALLVARACPDAVEALLRAGRPEEAVDVLRWVDARAARWRSPSLAAHAAHAHAVLAELTGTPPAEVDAAYDRAITLSPTGAVFDHGRLLLHHGAWLRRSRRPSQARASLTAAAEAFAGVGAVPWVDRAEAEQRATGAPTAVAATVRRVEDPVTATADGTGGSGGPRTLDVLTAQEQQVVLLAAEGLSNRQIGERLFLSPRTVGSHLYKAFPKLGVSNRAQLRAALDRTATPAEGAGEP